MGSMIFYSLFFGFFIIMILFIVFDKHLAGTIMTNTIADLNNTNTSFSQNVKGTVNIMNTSWMYIPLFALFGLIYFAFKESGGE